MSSKFTCVNCLIAHCCTSLPAYLDLSPPRTYKNSPFMQEKEAFARQKWKRDQKVKDFCQTVKRHCLPRTFFLLKLNGKSINAGGRGGGGVA